MLRAKYDGEKKTGVLIFSGLKDKDEEGRKAVIRTEDLTKEYNGFKAVDSLNLRVEEGEIYGLLGLITSSMSFKAQNSPHIVQTSEAWGLLSSLIFLASSGSMASSI